jgi:hypothetical protein
VGRSGAKHDRRARPQRPGHTATPGGPGRIPGGPEPVRASTRSQQATPSGMRNERPPRHRHPNLTYPNGPRPNGTAERPTPERRPAVPHATDPGADAPDRETRSPRSPRQARHAPDRRTRQRMPARAPGGHAARFDRASERSAATPVRPIPSSAAAIRRVSGGTRPRVGAAGGIVGWHATGRGRGRAAPGGVHGARRHQGGGEEHRTRAQQGAATVGAGRQGAGRFAPFAVGARWRPGGGGHEAAASAGGYAEASR